MNDELIKSISNMGKYTSVSGSKCAEGFKTLGVQIEKFNNLSTEEQKQFLIDGFNKIYKLDKSTIEEFERRHPDSWLNKHIIKD